MKKYFIIFLMFVPMLAGAQVEVEIDGIRYFVVKKGKTAEVRSIWDGYSGNVTIPESVEYEGVACFVTSIGDRAFRNCSSLTSVTIPNFVTRIGDEAFDGCSGLSSVTIPNSVTSIGNEAFYGCSGLTTAKIGNSVTNIGEWAFSNCSRLTSITIPNSVTSIGKSAFHSCNALTSVTIPNSVTSIGDNAFLGCTALTSVHISDLAAWCRIIFECKSTTTSNPLGLAHHLFLNGKEVKELVIPNSITKIEKNTFHGCSSLTSVNIGTSVTSIEDHAFSDCTNLTSVNIPNSVTLIGMCAFSDCANLTSVNIGSGVKSIGDDAFSNCGNLETVTCLAKSVPATHISNNPFNRSYVEYATLRVPIGSVNDYSSVNPWKTFGKIEGIDVGGSLGKCAKPTIDFVDGKISAKSETEGAHCVISGTVTSSLSGTDSFTPNLQIKVTAYATAEDYDQSETAEATFDLMQKINNIGVMQAELEKLKASNTALEKEMAEKDATIKNSHNELVELRKENERLQSTYDNATKDLSNLKQTNATLQENYDKIANELASLKQTNATLQSSNESMAKELADQKALASKLQSDYENAEKELASLKQTNATLQSNNESMAKELEALKSTHATLQSNYDNISKELTAYKLGDLNGDGVTDILDVEALIKLSSYSSSESALATLVEETGITLTEISEQYGDVEFYTLDGKKVSKPSQSGVYIVKKNGQTKMIVVKK